MLWNLFTSGKLYCTKFNILNGGSGDDTYSTLMSTTSSVAKTNSDNFNSPAITLTTNMVTCAPVSEMYACIKGELIPNYKGYKTFCTSQMLTKSYVLRALQ